MMLYGLRFSVAPAVVCSLLAISVMAEDQQVRFTTVAPAHVHQNAAGDEYFALSLRGPNTDTQVARDHVLLFDTSASQVGEHRRFGLQVLEAFLAGLSPDDRVRLFAVDVAARSVSDSWLTPGSAELQAAVRQIKKQVPLGATKLADVIESSLTVAASDRERSVVYIGDGMSTGDLIAVDQLRELTSSLRERRIAVHSFAVGPDTDLHLLGSLAQQTGGVCLFDRPGLDNDQAPAALGCQLAAAGRAPIWYPTRLTFEPAPQRWLPQGLPIRGDRATMLLGQGSLALGTTVTAEIPGLGTSHWTVEDLSAEPGNGVLADLWQQAVRDGGLSVSFAGEAMFQHGRERFMSQVDGIVVAGENALARNDLEAAGQLAERVHGADPQNVAGRALGNAVQNARLLLVNQVQPADPEGDAVVPAAPLPDAPAGPGPAGALIPSYEELQAIKTQRLQLQVTEAIKTARQFAEEEPDASLDVLRRTLNGVLSATDVDPTVREDLRLRLERVILDVRNRRDVVEQNQIRFIERQTQLEARARLTEQLLLEEERLEQLIDRVRGLINEGIHGDDNAYLEAREVAKVAVNLSPGEGTGNAAFFTAEAITQLNRAFRMRALRADRFLETLYQVELSHVPFPDEPPIRFPPAAVWRALTERRRKWASVDLRRETPNEERIRASLDAQTAVDFIDTPLRDALDFIEDLHDINIWIDETTLSNDGLTADDPVTLSLEGIRLRSALRLMLEPQGLTYVIEDEVMKITTQVAAEEILSVRVYPVADLVIPIITPQGAGLGQGLGGGGGIGGGQGQFGGGQGGGQFGGGGGGQFGGGGGGGFFSVPPEQIPAAGQGNVAPANPLMQQLKKNSR